MRGNHRPALRERLAWGSLHWQLLQMRLCLATTGFLPLGVELEEGCWGGGGGEPGSTPRSLHSGPSQQRGTAHEQWRVGREWRRMPGSDWSQAWHPLYATLTSTSYIRVLSKYPARFPEMKAYLSANALFFSMLMFPMIILEE